MESGLGFVLLKSFLDFMSHKFVKPKYLILEVNLQNSTICIGFQKFGFLRIFDAKKVNSLWADFVNASFKNSVDKLWHAKDFKHNDILSSIHQKNL